MINTTPHHPVRVAYASWLIATITGISLVVLWGWYSSQPHLTSFYLGTATMKANSALGFLLLALGLAGIALQRTRLTVICGLAVMVLATITIAEHLLGLGGGIDQLLMADRWSSTEPGRMAVGSAVSFALAGALLAMHPTHPQQHIGRYDALLAAFLVIPLFVFFSYVFAPEEVIRTPLLGTMTLQGCLNFLFFFFALALLTQSKGSVGLLNRNTINARNFRVLFFMVLILPLSLGSVLNYGVQQQWIGPGIGIAIFCLFSTLIIASALAHHTILLDHWFRQLLRERRRSSQLKDQMHELLEISAGGIILFDGDMQVMHANSGAAHIVGYSRSELQQMSFYDLLPPAARAELIDTLDRYLHAERSQAQGIAPERLNLQHKSGNVVAVSAAFSKKIGDEQSSVIAVLKSLSALDQQIRSLEKQASTDALTQLSNRAEFEQYCKNLATHGRRTDRRLCVLVLDIDNFKQVNDSFGHDTGDEVLKHFTQAAKDALRERDKLFRTGGEEFVIISNDLDCHSALSFAERIRLAVKERPFTHGGHTLFITCSIGVSVIDAGVDDIQTAVEFADQAMYQAKREGKDRCEISQF